MSLYSMAMLKHTCESVGVVFETEGYTMLIQLDSSEEASETETADVLGMEVADEYSTVQGKCDVSLQGPKDSWLKWRYDQTKCKKEPHQEFV